MFVSCLFITKDISSNKQKQFVTSLRDNVLHISRYTFLFTVRGNKQIQNKRKTQLITVNTVHI